MKVIGKVSTNIIWTKEAKENELPKYGSVRLKISSIGWGETNFSCDYKNGDFPLEIPYLDISYEISNPKYLEIECLNAGDLISLEIWQKAIYKKEGYFTKIQELEEIQAKYYYLKLKGDNRHVKSVMHLTSLSTMQAKRKKTLPTATIVEKMLTIKTHKPGVQQNSNTEENLITIPQPQLTLV